MPDLYSIVDTKTWRESSCQEESTVWRPFADVMCSVRPIEHTLLRVRRSKISSFPARLPNPASATSRPCGLKDMKLWGDDPKS